MEPDLERALDRGLELRPPDGELVVLPTYTAMLALQRIVTERGSRQAVLGANVKIRVGHLYPDYLNIYADRGNIAVFERRARLRGHELEVTAISIGDDVRPGEHDLLYIGGGQDREQALIAPDLVAKGPAIEAAVQGGAALLAVCGGYQLLGRGYLDRHGESMPGVGLFPHETVAGDRRMIGDVLLEMRARCQASDARSRDSRTTPAGPGSTRAPSRSAASSPASGTTASPAYEGVRVGRAIGTYLHGPLLPAEPVARGLAALAGARARAGGEPPELEPLPDRLEAEAHAGLGAARP